MSPHSDRPRVSCIVTTFNYAHFVTQAIDSALAQTYGLDSLEIIVVDGASTDDTPRVLEPYLPRITYIRELSNEGVVSSANKGLEAAAGDLIAFLNADDVWYPTSVERFVARFQAKPDSGLVYGDMEMIDAHGRSLHPSYYERFGIRPESGRVLGQLMRRNFISSGCFMFRAELLSACHPIPDWVPWEDWYIVLRLAEVADFEYLSLPVMRYRFHSANQVLMAEGQRLVATWRKELPFRRRLLKEIPLGAVSVSDLIGAVTAFGALARRLGEAAPDGLAEALPTPEEERIEASLAAAAASLSEQDRDHEAALLHWAHAIAHDPGDQDLRRKFARTAARLLDEQARAVNEQKAELRELSRLALAAREAEPVDDALQGLRDLASRVSETAPEPAPAASPLGALLERVDAVDRAERAAALAEVREHRPWTQGPFPVTPVVQVGLGTPAWRHGELLAGLSDELAGLRVLDVPSNAGYVAFALSLRGPEELVACEPGRFHHQALALDRLYSSGVDFRQLGWDDLDPHELGHFDLIHADGLLHREFRPIPALERVRDLLAEGGRLYLGFTRITDPERSEYVRFLDSAPEGDVRVLPGRTALSWMIEAAGLSTLRELAVAQSECSGIPVESGYLELTA
jgi:SAM-dependent methyltransferase